MKIMSILLSILILLVAFSTLYAGVETTKHNFSSSTHSPNAFFFGTRQLCVFCHTPHGGDQAIAPLWNHETNQSQTYIPYSSNTLDMNISQPHKGSMICLSCHDGTIAVNSLSNLPGPEKEGNYGSPGGSGLDAGGKLTSSSDAYVGLDLSDDHPVGITYDASQDPSGFYTKTGSDQSYPDKLLSEGLYVECSSCHDPHDDTFSNFLVESNSGSQLCLRCHTK
ncbi:MAG: cytochrome c3 family protein [candidate division Zixibacteria bacterium]|nr:cytochrome c3 family protein [candidate division Zixibacteria bacterium]